MTPLLQDSIEVQEGGYYLPKRHTYPANVVLIDVEENLCRYFHLKHVVEAGSMQKSVVCFAG